MIFVGYIKVDKLINWPYPAVQKSPAASEQYIPVDPATSNYQSSKKTFLGINQFDLTITFVRTIFL